VSLREINAKTLRVCTLSLRGVSAERGEAIYNLASFKDSIAESRVDKVMNCHEILANLSQWQGISISLWLSHNDEVVI